MHKSCRPRRASVVTEQKDPDRDALLRLHMMTKLTVQYETEDRPIGADEGSASQWRGTGPHENRGGGKTPTQVKVSRLQWKNTSWVEIFTQIKEYKCIQTKLFFSLLWKKVIREKIYRYALTLVRKHLETVCCDVVMTNMSLGVLYFDWHLLAHVRYIRGLRDFHAGN